ncbi:FMN-dependent NADH-azoreductase [Rheinheimera sediminis]|uniref:FMN-dependent NADH-azoreductase n=1 Tax=Rheinheimera sp. YQF-1 TaxID=2499626 RepID=UPI000FDC8DB0|nr:NAD(P)H-dependent oxidoreductase [Rheinheimera sp. YQF-1]RVT45377.1 FMN-dependent NADH-azoreductase [Rheinheimera sp. YQF-1]
MAHVLVINSSISGDKGQSTQLSQEFLAALPAGFSTETVDLVQDSYPHLTMTEMAAWMTPESDRTDEQKALAALSDEAVAQIKKADAIVMGVPMYNFGVPSQLKAYFDRLARAGITFKYTETGPVGLLQDKPVFIFATRGGLYQGTPMDSQTPFVTALLNFIGLKDLNFIYAEGLNMGPESAEKALSAAKARIAELAPAVAA